VCRWAADRGVDLIVAGTHGDAPGPRLPGGFARQLALHAPCPVMLVPPAARHPADAV
jgi:nucleotide-binding universal stress UspA family protein